MRRAIPRNTSFGLATLWGAGLRLSLTKPDLEQVSEIARGLSAALLGWRLRYATLSRLSGAGSRGDLVPAADLARRFSERLRDQRGAVCSLGLPQADRLVGPFPRGRSLLFLRGRLSGKSKLLQNVIHYNVATAGVPTHFYS